MTVSYQEVVPYSYAGNILNNGTDYQVVIGQTFKPSSTESIEIPRSNARPLIGGKTFPGRTVQLAAAIIDTTMVDTLRRGLYTIFDLEQRTPQALVVADDTNGNNKRYVLATVDDIQPQQGGRGLHFVISLKLHDEHMYQDVTEQAVVINASSSPASVTINNNGDAKIHPTFTLKPTVAKSNTNPYKRFLTVRWNGEAVSNYPLDVTNGGLDTQIATTNFDSATGDDIRLLVDGNETSFFLSGVDTATTSIWATFDFEASQSGTLAAALSTSDTEVTLNEDISNFPSQGLLELGNSEIVYYESKNDQQRRFYNITRATRGTTAVSGSVNDTVRWIQKEIFLEYGASGISAYESDSTKEPIFDYANSSNISWVYDGAFLDGAGQRPGSWTFTNIQNIDAYSATQDGAAVDPYAVLGLKTKTYPGFFGHSGAFRLYNAVGISAANFTDGRVRADSWRQRLLAYVRTSTDGSSYITRATITTPSANGNWSTTWSSNTSSYPSSTRYLSLWLGVQKFTPSAWYVEAGACTVTLNSSNTPAVVVGDEQSNYRMSMTITNQTSGHAFTVTYAMDINEQIEIDTRLGTVTDLTDNSPQFGALALEGGTRSDWLPLLTGDNILKFEDVGLTGITITVTYHRRFYY